MEMIAFCYIWGHNFWTNWDLAPLSTSKWPSEPQFCERWRYIWQKNGRKRSYNSYLRGTFISEQTLCTCKFEKEKKIRKFRNFFFIWFGDKIKLISNSRIRNSIIYMTLICSYCNILKHFWNIPSTAKDFL